MKNEKPYYFLPFIVSNEEVIIKDFKENSKFGVYKIGKKIFV
jgi:hypothetical protein